ncbi:MAG: lamin tail domain-containing protein [Deltaproteobacteria bacterium]|nr:lamin tail domain-containing protein [Deltaproteobacteria bacterium]
MKNATLLFIIVLGAVLGAAAGCMDIDLLDNMNPMDTETDTDNLNEDTVAKLDDSKISNDSDGVQDSTPSAAVDSDSPPPNDTADLAAPRLVSVCKTEEISLAGACGVEGPASLYLRFDTDEPALINAPVDSVVILSAPWATRHELVFAKADVPLNLEFSILDVNENASVIVLELRAITEPAVIISEVLADCIGPEPDGEYVKIANIGRLPVNLSGWMIDDNNDRNGDVIAEGTILPAGAEGTIAMKGFEVAQGLFIPLDSSIGSSGLKNSDAESIQLFDQNGVLMDEYLNEQQFPEEGIPAKRRHALLPRGSAQLWSASINLGQSP